MVTVRGSAESIESRLLGGRLRCPCGGVLAPWGHARRREFEPRRSRCRSCGRTHVLLPAELWSRRIIAHGHFLHDPAFRKVIAAGSSVADGQPFAVIRWNAAVTALELGALHATGSERAVLLIAASIAEGTPVSLRDCLGSLDRRNIALVASAIAAANG